MAVAKSHIGVWQKILENDDEYTLILEDDIWFYPGFSKALNRAWADVQSTLNGSFDILYLSYEEVKNGAPKTFISSNLFRPVRGLWNLSGYVLSRNGASKLLQLLPCRGPVDLWINHQFDKIDVVALKKSVVRQRPDISSTNSYSILPALTKIGAINSEGAALFQIRPQVYPVFVFGNQNTGLTSVAMALSMLGYKCCNDLESLPKIELDKLLMGRADRVFNAYVNIGSLATKVQLLQTLFPNARFIFTDLKNQYSFLENIASLNYTVIRNDVSNKWKILCEHLCCAPPVCAFPELNDVGQRPLIENITSNTGKKSLTSKRDASPWIVDSATSWQGIHCMPSLFDAPSTQIAPVKIIENFESIVGSNWILRNDTFTDNLALFRPDNIYLQHENGITLDLKLEALGVRDYSAAAITSQEQFLYGRFEAILKASNISGVVTGFFLHRNSPRQEIDIEIAGNRPNVLIANVFFNPGGPGAKFDYGYRGTPTYIDLEFDASDSFHHYMIEWRSNEICWFVDKKLVHRRVEWDPTPIPHLPMSLHTNIWPCRSKEFAGILDNRQLPAKTLINSINIDAVQVKTVTCHEHTCL
ncbi:family 16 glycosylhydrolase [Mucilaginibacter endophyticus]|uniref:family 16 glycosylhydrolase n=1 Tax=Mucilaginibacter endophyticus TaxID=2675003 RepID=UPI00244BC4B1|nr:family 16 glycosylhydrolase [Mucilaginibacter endophyticus]